MTEPTAKVLVRLPRIADARLSAPRSAGLDVSRLMEGAGEVAFTWDVERDHITWDRHVGDLLAGHTAEAKRAPPLSKDELAKGTAYLFRIAADHIAKRTAALLAAAPSGTEATGAHYRTQYPVHPNGRANALVVMVEEEGRWWPGNDGKPIRLEGVVRVITERHAEEARLRLRADHDILTGQLNRSALIDVLGVAIRHASATRQPCAFLLASVNGLDVVNETFGFDIGDEVLAGTGHLLRGYLRSGDSMGRYSSNKFGLVINNCGPGVMRVVADRLLARVRTTVIETTASKLPTAVSIGGICLPDSADSVSDALARALQALESARSKRLDSFVAYEPRPERESHKKRNAALASSLISALDDHRLKLLLQPMVSAKTGQPDHYECLLRMTTPEGAVISAGEFMPIAEHLGLSRLIDLRTLELAVGLLNRYPQVELSLNVSGLTAGDNDWLVALHRLTGGNRQITQRLTIEITETAAIHDLDQSMVFVDTVKDIGCKVAIDDFGVGYTNFRNLKLLNADLVKIDGAFIKNVCHDTGDQVFVKSMVELARAFGMKTVAEWVGDAATAKFLTEAGIDYLQGYHFGAPTAPETLLGG